MFGLSNPLMLNETNTFIFPERFPFVPMLTDKNETGKSHLDGGMRFEKDLNQRKKERKKGIRGERQRDGAEEGEGGQGPPHSATGKTAINNLHHLSLCAPLDHSTNSSRNLRQKHTHAMTLHTHTLTKEMHACKELH